MDNETGVISVFKDALREAAAESNKPFKDFPLGPQDRHLLADDLWSTYDNFALVESKASQHKLPTEYKSKEDRTKKLCEELEKNSEMAALHAKCHRIAWLESGTGRLLSCEYRQVICRGGWPETCKNISMAKPISIDDFAAGFFGTPPDHCVPAEDFMSYIKWVINIVTGRDREVLILARTRIEGKTTAAHITLNQLAKFLASENTRKMKY